MTVGATALMVVMTVDTVGTLAIIGLGPRTEIDTVISRAQGGKYDEEDFVCRFWQP